MLPLICQLALWSWSHCWWKRKPCICGLLTLISTSWAWSWPSQVVLVTTSEDMAEKTMKEVERQCAPATSPRNSRKEPCQQQDICIEKHGWSHKADNSYAPEHLIISANGYREIAEKINNAGSIFLVNLTRKCRRFASGTKPHCLPVVYAHAYSKLIWTASGKITYQGKSPQKDCKTLVTPLKSWPKTSSYSHTKCSNPADWKVKLLF